MSAPDYAAQFHAGDPVTVEFLVDGKAETRQGTFRRARRDSVWIMPTSGPGARSGFPLSIDWDIVTSITPA